MKRLLLLVVLLQFSQIFTADGGGAGMRPGSSSGEPAAKRQKKDKHLTKLIKKLSELEEQLGRLTVLVGTLSQNGKGIHSPNYYSSQIEVVQKEIDSLKKQILQKKGNGKPLPISLPAFPPPAAPLLPTSWSAGAPAAQLLPTSWLPGAQTADLAGYSSGETAAKLLLTLKQTTGSLAHSEDNEDDDGGDQGNDERQLLVVSPELVPKEKTAFVQARKDFVTSNLIEETQEDGSILYCCNFLGCGRKFSDSEQAKRDIRSHFAVIKSCKYCGRKYSDHRYYQDHLKTCEQNKERHKIGRFECLHCPRILIFSLEEDLLEHIQEAHPEVKDLGLGFAAEDGNDDDDES
ncbi:MAG: hypothetical protein EBU90_22345 [Proteobacteria bacterium]|nr:hypothetical protein [Pseudomonadota bacterium]